MKKPKIPKTTAGWLQAGATLYVAPEVAGGDPKDYFIASPESIAADKGMAALRLSLPRSHELVAICWRDGSGAILAVRPEHMPPPSWWVEQAWHEARRKL